MRESGDEGGVAEGVEAIILGNGYRIVVFDDGPGGKGGDQHDQAAAGEVKVGN